MPTETVTVWRVETEDGKGPWCGVNAYYCGGNVDTPDDDPGMGSWWMGMPPTERLAWIFGHIDKKRFELPAYRIRLMEHNCGMSVYEVPKEAFFAGATQVVFKREQATRISWTPITAEFDAREFQP